MKLAGLWLCLLTAACTTSSARIEPQPRPLPSVNRYFPDPRDKVVLNPKLRYTVYRWPPDSIRVDSSRRFSYL